MSIVIVGGNDRMATRYQDICKSFHIKSKVFTQMPADFEPAALEAQAVLAATYARSRHLSESEAPTAELHGADMSDDGTLYQAFFTESQAREVYGEDYGEALEKVSAAADKAEHEGGHAGDARDHGGHD